MDFLETLKVLKSCQKINKKLSVSIIYFRNCKNKN